MSFPRIGFLLLADAEDLAAAMLNDCVSGSGRSNADVAEAIGLSRISENVVRGWRRGAAPVTVPRLLQLVANAPSVGVAMVAKISSWTSSRGASAMSVISALDGVMQACLELAQIGYRVAADREVTLEEEELLAPAFTKLRIAINHYEACVLRRPVAVDRRSA